MAYWWPTLHAVSAVANGSRYERMESTPWGLDPFAVLGLSVNDKDLSVGRVRDRVERQKYTSCRKKLTQLSAQGTQLRSRDWGDYSRRNNQEMTASGLNLS